TKSSLKTLKEVAADGIIQALTIAKESADWNSFLKEAVGGVVAVVNLVMQVSDNWTEMEAVLNHINTLHSIVYILREDVQVHSLDIGRGMDYFDKCAFVMQNEFKIIREMQSHGMIRHGLQVTSDAEALLSACKKITQALDYLKLEVMLIIEQDTHLILKNIILRTLKTSKTAAHAADIDSDYVSRRSCTEGTRHKVLKAGMGKTTIAQTAAFGVILLLSLT
ncbi:hypothetical protein C0995_002497, partial [Termitomyces sp. Mi166